MVIASACLILALLAPPTDTVVFLTNGDRISGKVMARGRRLMRLQTPHGLLQISLDKVDRLRHPDGTEEVIVPPPSPAPPAAKPPPPVRVVVAVTGKTFWQAWDAEAAPPDPTLRLELRVDDRPTATWIDSTVEQGEIKKAVVNSFSFTPESLKVAASPGVKALSPEIRPGRIQLALDLPAELAGPRKLRLAYQANAGSALAPEWRDLALSEVTLVLRTDAPNVFRFEQDRGAMEFAKRHMKNVESFQLSLKLDTSSDEP